MDRMTQMLRTHPDLRDHALADDLGRILSMLAECEAVCRLCADACLHEEDVASLRTCIERNLACADACDSAVTALAAGSAHPDASLLAALDACALACGACAAECEMHAGHHEHCRICAEACRECERMCADVVARMSSTIDMREGQATRA